MNEWRILVVEDEYDGQQVISKILKYMRIESDIAASAEDALLMLGKQTYTAMIIDLALPGMDGIQLFKQIRASSGTASLPCIMVTAYHSSQVKHAAIEAGFDAYFAKPIDDTLFIRELEHLLPGSSR